MKDPKLNPKRIFIAYSGGIDSHVLLHFQATMHADNMPYSLEAIHVNHGLSSHADQWQQHCQTVCDQLAIKLHVLKVDCRLEKGESLEAKARQARYHALQTFLQAGDVVYSGHNQDDQVETLFLQLLRGAGVKGLAAMPKTSQLGIGRLIRPQLNLSRAEIEAYAAHHNLSWIEDESNQSRRFDRNYLRHEIIPLLKKRWPGLDTTVTRSAQHCAESSALLDEFAQQDIMQIFNGEITATLSIVKLMGVSQARRKNLLRYWIQSQGFSLPSEAILDELVYSVITAKQDANPKLTWKNTEIHRYRDQLFIMPSLEMIPENWQAQWDLIKPLLLPAQLGSLCCEKSPTNVQVTVKFRQGGETVYFNEHTHELKKLFQQWGIPPWQRDRIPLVYIDNQLTTIVGYYSNNSSPELYIK